MGSSLVIQVSNQPTNQPTNKPTNSRDVPSVTSLLVSSSFFSFACYFFVTVEFETRIRFSIKCSDGVWERVRPHAKKIQSDCGGLMQQSRKGQKEEKQCSHPRKGELGEEENKKRGCERELWKEGRGLLYGAPLNTLNPLHRLYQCFDPIIALHKRPKERERGREGIRESGRKSGAVRLHGLSPPFFLSPL
ncbi:hypothetical protein H6P81_004668 [Aristolochia fimbriata]|uniref:Uncharacterized protein n=1 Tax=Aristolochia fimbriata TaxID=158543 RepID=A0AAV7ETQ7_ARIFI|nr:hypothetical protein H6P81_004668 [Aristolochia fimbriata]